LGAHKKFEGYCPEWAPWCGPGGWVRVRSLQMRGGSGQKIQSAQDCSVWAYDECRDGVS